MSSVLDRDALESSPLADLHVIANELGVDGFRRLRKADLVDAILGKQDGADAGAVEEPEVEVEAEVEAVEAEVEVEAPRPRRAAPSASPRSCGSTRSTAVRPTRSPRAPSSRTCPPSGRPSGSRSDPKTSRSRRSSG